MAEHSALEPPHPSRLLYPPEGDPAGQEALWAQGYPAAEPCHRSCRPQLPLLVDFAESYVCAEMGWVGAHTDKLWLWIYLGDCSSL